jgi:hypothetical protein
MMPIAKLPELLTRKGDKLVSSVCAVCRVVVL